MYTQERMKNILRKRKSTKRQSGPKDSKKPSRGMKLTELQMIAKKKGIRFVGLTKNELYKELVNYGFVH